MTTKEGLRPTRVADAKKNNWVPSVTTVMDVLNKPALINWKVEQHLAQAYKIHPLDYEYKDWLSTVKRVTAEEMDKAPSAGSDFHTIIEQYFKGQDYPSEHQELLEAIRDLIEKETGVKESMFKSEVYFADPIGYAGQADLLADEWVIDFKTKQTADKFKPGKMAYPDHARQLGAYRMGLGRPKAANLFICLETGELDFHVHSEADLQKGYNVFLHALQIWKIEKFDSSFGE
jgi:hypothetical protein